MLTAGTQARNIVINGRRTSVRMEVAFWQAFDDIARFEKCSINEICNYISLHKDPELSLTSAIRIYITLYYKQAVTLHARQEFHGKLQSQIALSRRQGRVEG
jgi:predicted DNA-binding ribbon-helix-helix protein